MDKNRIELITTYPRMVEVVALSSTASRVAVDIESNGFFRYHERVCLIQIATGDNAFLIDPLAIKDLRPVGDLLSDGSVEKVFHAADYDLRSLDRDWEFHVASLFDTSIAAAFVGATQLGLKSVLFEYAHVELTKHRKLQRSDWTNRPLGSDAIAYAADDVLHLGRLRDVLSARLVGMSRLDWAKEEFKALENVRHAPRDRNSAFLSIKGSRDLDGTGLAILRSLFLFREREARRLDRTPFRVIPDSTLVQLASNPHANLSAVKGLGMNGRPPADRSLKRAIGEGLASLPVARPRQPRAYEPLEPSERKRVAGRLQKLKSWRSQLGLELQLNPGLLWPAVSLDRLARRPGCLDPELSSPDVRNWQKKEFGEALSGLLETLS